MRGYISIGALLIAGAIAGGNMARGEAPDAPLPLTYASLAKPHATAKHSTTDALAQRKDVSPVVDVELILAVDISYSMDLDELALQREGYALAVTSQEFLKALKTGPTGKVAITYFEWAASSDQKVIIPWRVVDGPESAGAVAAEILKAPLRRASRTSISGAINFSLPLFEQNPYPGIRKVIDISGDGPNNNGVPVTVARDAALEKGITINGLPIMVKELNPATMDIPNLDLYYEDCVIGGPGSFVVSIKAKEKFAEAIRTKLVLEVANRMPERPVVPVSNKEPRVPCLIGEQIWQDRWGR
ncbi:MAG: hypothetical protein A4S14_12935 [Proteobacteria bacterium SG_bin9]|nr:MAG: hypothetical protein A4S14_12935 [Proteobacteria bacterium SG_bin9]